MKLLTWGFQTKKNSTRNIERERGSDWLGTSTLCLLKNTRNIYFLEEWTVTFAQTYICIAIFHHTKSNWNWNINTSHISNIRQSKRLFQNAVKSFSGKLSLKQRDWSKDKWGWVRHREKLEDIRFTSKLKTDLFFTYAFLSLTFSFLSTLTYMRCVQNVLGFIFSRPKLSFVS